jgi:hypothetical protein
LPLEVGLAVAGANPVVGAARLRFALPAAADVELSIFDVSGRRVAQVAAGEYSAGYHTVTWGAGGARPARGIYFARLLANGREYHRRVVLLR